MNTGAPVGIASRSRNHGSVDYRARTRCGSLTLSTVRGGGIRVNNGTFYYTLSTCIIVNVNNSSPSEGHEIVRFFLSETICVDLVEGIRR